jgi:hypothetical protein
MRLRVGFGDRVLSPLALGLCATSRFSAALVPGICSVLWLTLGLGMALRAQPANTKAPNAADQRSLRIDANLAQSLARTGCAIHVRSNSPAPFAEVLNLPMGPYRKVYGTKSGARQFGIVGDDCDYLANPVAPSVRMLLVHRMENGLIYIALIDARGEVLALLNEIAGSPPQYASAKPQDIDTIHADLKSEAQGWNGGLDRLLQNQNQQESQASRVR